MAVALMARQRIREVRDILKHDREAALTELAEMFQDGAAPSTLLDGRYSGQIITTTYHPSINALVRFVFNTIFLWKGISFDIETGMGENVVARSVKWLIKLLFRRYTGISDDGPQRFLAFQFRTFIGSSLHYPDHYVLVADYCLDENPAPLRRVVHEIVEIGEGYYLGRMLVQQYPCRWLCRGYFTLSELPEAVGMSWVERVA